MCLQFALLILNFEKFMIWFLSLNFFLTWFTKFAGDKYQFFWTIAITFTKDKLYGLHSLKIKNCRQYLKMIKIKELEVLI